MFVGVCRIALRLPGVSSLKEKRSVVRKVVTRTRDRFNVAVAEVEAQDQHRRAVIGFAVIGNEGAHCDRLIEEIGTFVESLGLASVEWRKTQRLALGDSEDLARPLADLDDQVLGTSWDALEEAP